MLNKLKFGSSIAAIILFFLPWIDFQCSEKSLMTQTGVQVIYGGATPNKEFEASMDEQPDNSGESLGIGFFVGVAFLAVLAGCFFAWRAMMTDEKQTEKFASIFPAMALGALLIQLAIGFPIKQSFTDAMAKSDDQSELDSAMQAAVLSNFDIKITSVFYAELLFLAFPTLILLNGFIDRQKKDMPLS